LPDLEVYKTLIKTGFMNFLEKITHSIRKFYTFSRIKNKAVNLKTYDENIIHEILDGRDKTLRLLYRNYRHAFMQWAKPRFSLDDTIIEDAFQDALEVFYRNVVSGKLTTLSAPLQNYLAGIGRLKLLQYLDKNSRIEYPENITEEQSNSIENFLETLVENEIEMEKIVRLKLGFDKLSDTCQLLLTKRFYENKSIDDITKEMNYENANTTSAALSRCLKNLKNHLQ
jgi:DNA-directed RNA polymerase specialized sigma24 family protein